MLWHFIFIATSNITQWSVQAWNAFVSLAFSGYMLLPNWMLFTYHFLSYSYPYNNNNNIPFFPKQVGVAYLIRNPIQFYLLKSEGAMLSDNSLHWSAKRLIYVDSFETLFQLILVWPKCWHIVILLDTFLRPVARIIFSINRLDGSTVPD